MKCLGLTEESDVFLMKIMWLLMILINLSWVDDVVNLSGSSLIYAGLENRYHWTCTFARSRLLGHQRAQDWLTDSSEYFPPSSLGSHWLYYICLDRMVPFYLVNEIQHISVYSGIKRIWRDPTRPLGNSRAWHPISLSLHRPIWSRSPCLRSWHYNDVIMGSMASQITSLTIVKF